MVHTGRNSSNGRAPNNNALITAFLITNSLLLFYACFSKMVAPLYSSVLHRGVQFLTSSYGDPPGSLMDHGNLPCFTPCRPSPQGRSHHVRETLAYIQESSQPRRRPASHHVHVHGVPSKQNVILKYTTIATYETYARIILVHGHNCVYILHHQYSPVCFLR